MEGRRPRAELVPNANNPRLLLRLVGFVSTGVRRPAPLAEVLEVELRTVHYYSQAGEWLGLLEAEGELKLTPRGLALAYAEPGEQQRLYAEAVWSNPLAVRVMGGRAELATTDEITALLLAAEPAMSPVTARRRASAVRSLLAPAFERRPDPRAARGSQLGLPFPAPAPAAAPAPVDLRAGATESPDVYRRLLLALLDHGELGTGQVRAVLDEMGARDAPLGPYVEMATRRGDAVRIDDRLVATRGAAERRDVAEDGALVALTDPLYREYLGALDAAGLALTRARDGGASPEDLRLRGRLSQLAARFAPWDLRIFGRRLQPGQVESAAAPLLLGRRLAGMPVASSTGEPLAETGGAFTEQVATAGVAVAFPRALLALRGGVAEVNQRLRVERSAPAGVRPPGPLDPRVRVHGGLFAPGEAPARAIPDNLSLRLRCLTHTPALSLLAALLLAGRRGAGRPSVRSTLGSAGPPTGAPSRDAPVVAMPGGERLSLLGLLERHCQALGMVVLRPAVEGLADATLVGLAVDLGIAVHAGDRLLLDEALFARLQEDPECRLVYEALLPVEDRLMGWIEGL